MKNYKVLAAVFTAAPSVPSYCALLLRSPPPRISARYSAALTMKLGIAAPVGQGCHSLLS